MNKPIFIVHISAEGYETTYFEDYATALDYYKKLKHIGLNPELEEKMLVCDFDSRPCDIEGFEL